MEDIDIMRDIKREFVRMRREIDSMADVEDKRKALRVYAELLTCLEVGALGEHTNG